MEIRIYTFPNSGFFYDFGYLIGGLIASIAVTAPMLGGNANERLNRDDIEDEDNGDDDIENEDPFLR